MKKVILALVVISFVIFGGCAEKIFAKKQVIEKNESDIEKLMLEQDDAICANEKIYSSFSHCSDGRWIYLDHYGDTYIDGGKLYLCLKHPAEEEVEYYQKLAGQYSSAVIIVDVDFDRNELQKCADELADRISRSGCSITSYCVDVSNNGLYFTADGEFVDAIKIIAKQFYPQISVRVEAVNSPVTY